MSQSHEIGENILSRTPYGVRVEGVNVIMTIGKKSAIMGYQEALTLAAFLRNGGREAKRNAGDFDSKFTTYMSLTDGNLDELKAQRSKDGTAVFKNVRKNNLTGGSGG